MLLLPTMDGCAGTLRDLDLTPDEVERIKNAFKDPEFQKLFREYADEISNPENRKRYEEDIRLLELERGIDVEFVNPTPGHCLKTYHWPKVATTGAVADQSDVVSVKVFINVCKSDKVECPTLKSTLSNPGDHVTNGSFWSLPHCFLPPREDLDKRNRRATVYDVAFHSKAFDLALTHASMRRLLDYTAVDGVRRQFNLCLGKTAQQATYLARLFESSKDEVANAKPPIGSSLSMAQSSAHEEATLKAVRTVKGVAYKGVARPTVIRRHRPDYSLRQAELQKQLSADMESCSDPSQREALKMLATYPNVDSGAASSKATTNITGHSDPIEPVYTVTHCSEFDMINSRDAPDVNPLRPPDSLKIAVTLPGLNSAACLDLDVTSTCLMLTSEKPVAYQLNLQLPYEVEETKGVAKFDKSTSVLIVTIPVLKKVNADSLRISSTSEKPCRTGDSESKGLLLCSSDRTTVPSSATNNKETAKNRDRAKRPRRKRNRRRSSASDACNETGISPAVSPYPDVVTESSCSGNTEVHASTGLTKPFGGSQPPSDSGRCDQASFVPCTDVTATWIDIQELRVTKDRRLAPVRFRQDPFSLSILLPVRGIVPSSLSLHWSTEPTDSANQDIECPCSVAPLLLLLQFSSRGTGGCTMDWGLVLRCPSPDEATLSCQQCVGPLLSEHRSLRDQRSFSTLGPPTVIQSTFSSSNAVLIVAKSCASGTSEQSLSHNQNPIHDQSIWWTSVAVGRTLSAGMQQYPFVGLDSCLTACADILTNTHCDPQGDFGERAQNYVHVSALLPDRCDISWCRSCKPPSDVISLPQVCLPSIIDPTASEAKVTIPIKSRANPALDSTWTLKSILKSRSYSESSVDEQVTGFVCLRDAGLADTGTEHLVSSDDFPSVNSEDESKHTRPVFSAFHDSQKSLVHVNGTHRLRRCHSNEKLVVTDVTASDDRVCFKRISNGGHQRRHSVNFSSHDQQLAYSPRDTVETLHNVLLCRRKKSRRRDSRRRDTTVSSPHPMACDHKSSKRKASSSHCVSNVALMPDDDSRFSVNSNSTTDQCPPANGCGPLAIEPTEHRNSNDQFVCGSSDRVVSTDQWVDKDAQVNTESSNPPNFTPITRYDSSTSAFSNHPDPSDLRLSTTYLLELDEG